MRSSRKEYAGVDGESGRAGELRKRGGAVPFLGGGNGQKMELRDKTGSREDRKTFKGEFGSKTSRRRLQILQKRD